MARVLRVRGQRVYEASDEEARLSVSMLVHRGIDARLQRDGETSLIIVPAGSTRAVLDEVLHEWAPRSRLVEVH